MAPASTFFSTGVEGPLARTAEDAALLLDVMARPWPGDLYGWSPATRFADAVGRRPDRPLKVAMWTGTGIDGLDPHPQAVLAVERTAGLLRELGHDVREIAAPARYDERMRQAITPWFAYAVAAGVPAMVPAGRRELLLPLTRHLLATGEALTGIEVVMTQMVLARYASVFLAALDGFDIALTPTTSGPPVPVGHFLARGVEGVMELMVEWSCYTPWANLTGQPAVSLPSHLDGDGLPYGV